MHTRHFTLLCASISIAQTYTSASDIHSTYIMHTVVYTLSAHTTNVPHVHCVLAMVLCARKNRKVYIQCNYKMVADAVYRFVIEHVT